MFQKKNLMNLESILEQIDDPLSTNVNFIDVIVDKCSLMKEQITDEDDIAKIDDSLRSFFGFVIEKINDRFDIGLDIEYICSLKDVVEIGEALYTYFILRYIKNISRFFTKYIKENKKEIVDYFNDNSKKDVSTLAYKKQIKNRDDLVIVTNLPSIIKYIIDLEVDIDIFIELSVPSDNFEGAVVKKLLDDGHIIGDFVPIYLESCMDKHDYVMDEILTEIKMKFLKNIK